MMEPTDEDRRIDPNVQIIADNLPALVAIYEACVPLFWLGEGLSCAGLLFALSGMVEADTPPDSEANRIAAGINEMLHVRAEKHEF